MGKQEYSGPGPTMQKIEDMMRYALPEIDKFPRQERSYGGLATKLRVTMMNMADRCGDTRKCFYPKSLLKELGEMDKEIAHAKFYVKLAYDMKLFPMKKYSIINDFLEQIGKMTGSWINTVLEAEKNGNNGNKAKK